MYKGQETGLIDKNGRIIRIGDTVRLKLDSGEIRNFRVCYTTVIRTVKTYDGFDDDEANVAITGITFCWENYHLFPCVDEHGVPDTLKMEVIL